MAQLKTLVAWAVFILTPFDHPGYSKVSEVICADPKPKVDHCLKGTSASEEKCSQSHTGDTILTPLTGKVQEPILPALIPSLFSNVPPVINFVLPGQRRETFPDSIKSRLFWYKAGSPLVSSIALASGYTLTDDDNMWVGGYTGCFPPSETHMFTTITPNKKYNHLPNNWSIGCKDKLAQKMRKMKMVHGKKFNFHPPTYLIPAEIEAVKKAWEIGPQNQLWILKPFCFYGGKGIEVIHQFGQIPLQQRRVAQRYIPNPYLINGYKFDLRVLVLVTSVDPLRVYMYPDGLVRFATKKFTTSAFDETIHLTNVEVNAKKPDYQLRYSLKTGHKWSFYTLWEYLKSKDGTDHEPIWEKIKDIALKTIISGEPEMFEGVQTYLQSKYSGHELFGFDILLDKNLKPWVLEVNVAPGIQGHAGNPHPVFDPLCIDMLNLAGYRIPREEDHENDGESGSSSISPNLMLDERWWTKNLSNVEQDKHKYYCEHFEDKKVLSSILDTLTPDDIRVLVDTMDENNRRGSFDRIFPRLDTEYDVYFKKPRYHNLLVHEWIKRYHGNEEEGIALLESYCKKSKHLSDY